MFNSGISKKILPVHLKPLSDELLSSWINRIATSNGLSLKVFQNIFFKEHRLDLKDIDNYRDDKFFMKLSDITGINIAKIKQLSLTSLDGIMFDESNEKTKTQLVIPKQFRYLSNIIRICPSCLREDKSPYFRKQWRFTFYNICEKHQKKLINQCKC